VEFDLLQVLAFLKAAFPARDELWKAIAKAEEAIKNACFGTDPPVSPPPAASAKEGVPGAATDSCGMGIFFPKPPGVAQMIAYGGLSFPNRTQWGQFLSEFCYAPRPAATADAKAAAP
jgi:hypothetical protein